MRVLKTLCCAAAITVALAPSARADEWNKKTILTFSGPVQIPGATLPAGSYVFKLADIPGNRHVVQVFDGDRVPQVAGPPEREHDQHARRHRPADAADPEVDTEDRAEPGNPSIGKGTLGGIGY